MRAELSFIAFIHSLAPDTICMNTLEQRLFHLFEPQDRKRARRIVPDKVSCPRVGQVQATLAADDGTSHQVLLELSANRRGGMILESRCTSPDGRAGRPCAMVAAVLLEIDRRGLLAGIAEQTPVTLDVVPDDELADDDTDHVDASAASIGSSTASQPTAGESSPHYRGVAGNGFAPAGAVGPTSRRGSRQPAWATELETRRRLVEPAVRSAAFALGDLRKSTGTLMFLLDPAAAEQRVVVVLPCRMGLDELGQPCGRPKPITIGPNDVRFDQFDADERQVLAALAGTMADEGHHGGGPLERRTMSRFVLSRQSAARDLAMLCEHGRLVLQPEPRRAPETVVPLVWDASRPWEFALVVEPGDDCGLEACLEHDLATGTQKLARPKKASLNGLLVRGSERRSLQAPRLILRAGFIVLGDRLARLVVDPAFTDGRTSLPEDDDPSGIRGWMDQFDRRGPIELAGSQIDGLIERLAGLADVPRLELPGWTGWQVESGRPQPKLVLDDSPSVAATASAETVDPEATIGRSRRRPRRGRQAVQLGGTIWFDYGGILIAADDPAGGAADPARRRLVRRNRSAERAALAALPRFGFGPARAHRTAETEATETAVHHVEVPRARLDASVSQLAAVGWAVEVAGRRYRPAGSVAWNVTSGIDWFELSGSIDFGGVVADMPALLTALARGDRAVDLEDGTRGILPADFAEQLEPLLALADQQNGRLRYSRMQAALLDALIASMPQSQVDDAFAAIRDELAAGGRPEPEHEPEGFAGTLRHYQREGLGWLAFLERLGLGGCLADDMGLGKTIQVLALFMRRQQVVREAGLTPRPSLVVVPKSLIFNWMEEARRFAPQLRLLNYTGQERTEATESIGNHDLVLTTYGTLRRDIVQHRKLEFDYVVLDEAQAIKNAASQAAKACRLLKARQRLALTGTPVENHIGELWSIFEFLNPGQLGTASRLKRFLAGGRGNGAELVARAVRPYLLRRTKSQVLADLPVKTEQTLFCELGDQQRKAYDELRSHFQRELASRIGQQGLGRSRIAVLEALLRLRQAACHPGLIDANRIDEPSAKLDNLLEQLGEVLDEGHKVLVFSQFTSFLAILRRQLDARGQVYEYLDGKTTDRQSRVERFQEDPDCRLFLVSLKAGGQGLNLTAADYVYILDPWWNPAVEAQAIDRAHRIGQTRPVFAYRLIARNTVEEKILALQEQKRELADSIVTADTGILSGLTAEDVEMLLS